MHFLLEFLPLLLLQRLLEQLLLEQIISIGQRAEFSELENSLLAILFPFLAVLKVVQLLGWVFIVNLVDCFLLFV